MLPVGAEAGDKGVQTGLAAASATVETGVEAARGGRKVAGGGQVFRPQVTPAGAVNGDGVAPTSSPDPSQEGAVDQITGVVVAARLAAGAHRRMGARPGPGPRPAARRRLHGRRRTPWAGQFSAAPLPRSVARWLRRCPGSRRPRPAGDRGGFSARFGLQAPERILAIEHQVNAGVQMEHSARCHTRARPAATGSGRCPGSS